MSDDTKPAPKPPVRFLTPVIIEGASGPMAVMKEDPEGRYVHWTEIVNAHPDLTRVTVVGEVSEEMVERALYAYWQKDRHAQAFNFHDRGSMRAALTAALLPSATVKE
jgi:uncharacterized membrane protein